MMKNDIDSPLEIAYYPMHFNRSTPHHYRVGRHIQVKDAMRFLFVNPHYPISETPSPPLGIAYLAAALEQAGVTVRVLDFVVFPYEKAFLAEELRRFAPRFLGVTAVTMTFNHAMQIVTDAKAISPDLVTLMGGPHASFLAREILARFPALDIVVRGEGEETLVDFVRAVSGERARESVPGMTFRRGSEISATPDRSPMDVKLLPLPARHLLSLGRYRALGMPISMTTSRGCPYSCIFCAGRKMAGARVRYRHPAAVVDEMTEVNRLGFHQINLADDLFTANREHCLSVCNEIIRRGLHPSWTAFARVDTVSIPILSAMRSAGCHTVSFGIESGNPGMLRRIKKGITRDQARRAAEMCRGVGMAAQASFILGLPGETPATLADTLAFGEELNALGVQYGFHLLAPFPGTDIWENRHRYDLRILSTDWDAYHANRAVTETPSVPRERLDEIAAEWDAEFLTRLGEIDAARNAGTADPGDAHMLSKLEHTVRIHDWMMDRAIEQKGTWRMTGEPPARDQLLDQLAARLDGTGGGNRQLVRDSLKYAADNGNLRCTIEDGRIRWAWLNRISAA